MSRLVFSIFILLFLVGCASGTQMLRKVDPGMSPQQVDEIMGRRDGFSSAERGSDTFTLYRYTNKYCNAHVSLYDKCDFFVIFKNDHVVETGVKDIRSNSPNMQFLYIFKQP